MKVPHVIFGPGLYLEYSSILHSHCMGNCLWDRMYIGDSLQHLMLLIQTQCLLDNQPVRIHVS